MQLILGRASRLLLLGIGAGVVLSIALTRALRGMLFGIGSDDPRVLAIVLTVLVAVTALASYVPALRATKVDPMVALRDE